MPEKTNNTKPRARKTQEIDMSYGHLQPQATDIERVVLGALMIDEDAFSVVSERLHPETFYEPRHQKIYHAIQALSIEERPVDIMTVTEQLKRENELENVGGPGYIVELSSQVVSSAHIEYHAQILAQKHLARQLITYASKLSTSAFDETVNVDELMQEAEAQLFELSQKNMRSDYMHIDPVLKLATEAIQSAASRQENGLTGIPSGMDDLDKITAGWQPSDLIIIAGRPAMGKTSFALSIAKNIAVDHQIPIAFFSLEMTNVQLANRLISNVCEISGTKILSGQLDKEEWMRFDKMISRLYGTPLYVDDSSNLSIFELRTKARRLVREKGVKIIMIDYLQLMNASGIRFGSRQEEVSTISRSLKGLAKELNVPIIALSQLNRSVDTRDNSVEGVDGKRPQLSDLRESGAIEQDADMVIFVHRPEYYKIYEDNKNGNLRGKAFAIIAKHRKGATGDVMLAFRQEYTRFENNRNTSTSYAAPPAGGYIDSKMNSPEGDPFGGGDMERPAFLEG